MEHRSSCWQLLIVWHLCFGRVLSVRETVESLHDLPEASSSASAAPVTIKTYWVRHGYSCANLLKRDERDKKKIDTLCDPHLSNVGMARSVALGELVRKELRARGAKVSDLVFSSWMVRTIETALYMFPNARVAAIPYIAEVGKGPDNMPLNAKQKKEKLGDQATGRLTFTSDCGLGGCDSEATGAKTKSDYKKFLRYFPGVLRSNFGKEPSNVLHVMIFSHLDYIWKYPQCFWGKGLQKGLLNNQVFEVTYTLDWGNESAALVKEGSCQPLFNVSENVFPDKPALLCQEDIERCGSLKSQCGLEIEEIEDKNLKDKVEKLNGTANFDPLELENHNATCSKLREEGKASILLRDQDEDLPYVEKLGQEWEAIKRGVYGS